MTEYIGKLRLIVPPALLMILIAFSLDPNIPLPDLIKNQPVLQLSGALTIILILGFVISSIIAVIVNVFSLATVCPKEKPCRAEKYLSRKIIESAECELVEWGAIGEKELTKGQILKRWDMAMINFNAAATLLLYLLFLITFSPYLAYSTIRFSFLIITGSCIFLMVFLYNGWRAYWSNHIVVERLVHRFVSAHKI